MSERIYVPEGRLGQRYGRLELVDYVGNAPDHDYVYVCRCECGRTVRRSLRDLRRGYIEDCGCGKVRARKRRRTDAAPPLEDCKAYMPEKNNCVALKDLYCASEGRCPFYRAKEK